MLASASLSLALLTRAHSRNPPVGALQAARSAFAGAPLGTARGALARPSSLGRGRGGVAFAFTELDTLKMDPVINEQARLVALLFSTPSTY